MALLLFILFIAVPIAEIVILIELGGWLGLWPTLALIIFTAFVGTWIIRAQSISTVQRAQDAVAGGRMPVDSVIDAVSLLVAGAFLLTPGLLTDFVGFSLLVPPFRQWLARWLFNQAKKHAHVHVHTRTTTRSGPDPRSPFARSDPGAGPVIDGEFERMTPEEPRTEGRANQSGRNNPWSGDRS